MDYELRVMVEKVAVSSQEVVKRDTIKTYDITGCEFQIPQNARRLINV